MWKEANQNPRKELKDRLSNLTYTWNKYTRETQRLMILKFVHGNYYLEHELTFRALSLGSWSREKKQNVRKTKIYKTTMRLSPTNTQKESKKETINYYSGISCPKICGREMRRKSWPTLWETLGKSWLLYLRNPRKNEQITPGNTPLVMG